ncbi:MAG TPA: cation transporter [Flavobacterium sp.]|jgi:divalent metal cation (Fe/Co/Zn/Cd) transporter|nr:cation transporter [Flavobacterium sp.]
MENQVELIDSLYRRAAAFATFLLLYNIIEGAVAIFMGISDESLTLFGFGIDSLVEVASNLGVIYMIRRIRQNPNSDRTVFENSALRITGYGFLVLALILLIGVVFTFIENHRPETTTWGIVISLFSIIIMYYVLTSQIKIGKALNSQPIISDAKCTMVCVYMSIVLLLSSFVYETTGFAYSDVLGALGLIYFSLREGKEALYKAKGKECTDNCC